MGARDREADQSMSERQLIYEILTLVVAGHEATASSLAWTWHLCRNAPMSTKSGSRNLRRCEFNPQHYLADVLGRIANHPARQIAELLLWNWKPIEAPRIAA